ncbi:MAG: hypothetical protein JSS99_01820 [Actinobacteria bacterium]|nr:hypothetical protein [Actinomycetota bacterium]
MRKLEEEARHDGELSGLRLEHVGTNGLRIVRRARPDALVYCASVEHGETFGPQDLEHVLGVLSEAQFVVVVPTRIDHEVFVHAEELGVCVDGFGELVAAFGSALRQDDPHDLDVLLLYDSRASEVAVRGAERWSETRPPVHIIAMTRAEEREYRFIQGTSAVRLL